MLCVQGGALFVIIFVRETQTLDNQSKGGDNNREQQTTHYYQESVILGVHEEIAVSLFQVVRTPTIITITKIKLLKLSKTIALR